MSDLENIQMLRYKVTELEKDLDDMIGEHNDLKQDAYDAKKACRIMEMETGLHRERADKAVKESVEFKKILDVGIMVNYLAPETVYQFIEAIREYATNKQKESKTDE